MLLTEYDAQKHDALVRKEARAEERTIQAKKWAEEIKTIVRKLSEAFGVSEEELFAMLEKEEAD